MAITRLANNDLLTPTRIPSARGGAIPQGPQFNSASGGTTTDVSNYNGTGQTWRVHDFTSSSTFTVTDAISPFRVFVVNGGRPGIGGGEGFGAFGGQGGGYIDDTLNVAPGANTVVIGGSNQRSSLGSISPTDVQGIFASGPDGSYAAGGGGGAGSAGSGSPSQRFGGNGGAGRTSTITGSAFAHSGGGGGGGFSAGGSGGSGGGGGGCGWDTCGWGAGGSGGANTGGGGGGQGKPGGGGGGGGAGGTGRVIVAYRIA